MANSSYEMIKSDSKMAIFRKCSRPEYGEKEHFDDKEDFFISENSSFKAESIE